MDDEVAVITGANSGVGLAVAKRLLVEVASTRQIRLCLACRNMEKAEVTRQTLLREHPGAKIDLLQVDTSSPESAINAAKEIKKRYTGVRWLYCNAGIMPLGGMNWRILLTLRRSVWAHLFSTGEGLINHIDWTMDNGIQAVFSTNVLGHYLMIKELEEYLIDQEQPCQIIWTSSNTARFVKIDPEDIQDRKGISPYPSSKKLMDLISLNLNRCLNSHGVYSDTTCPGMVVSQMTLTIMPSFMWHVILPIIFLIRVFITHFITFDPLNGAEALIWLSKQNPATLDHTIKYFSRKPPINKTYVLQEKIDVSDQLLNDVMQAVNNVSQPYLSETVTIK